MALVGLHITQKTPSAPQWIWSTFEHLDNVPGPGAQAPYSFFKPGCADCPVNRQTKAGVPAQLTRLNPIPASEPDCGRPNASVDNVQLLNANVADALGKQRSVFRNYQLIGAQRPLAPAAALPT